VSAAGPLETRLFRLCLLLQFAFWTALIAVLGRLLWATATGRPLPDPMLLAAIVAALVAMQLVAWFAWWRVRSLRRRESRP